MPHQLLLTKPLLPDQILKTPRPTRPPPLQQPSPAQKEHTRAHTQDISPRVLALLPQPLERLPLGLDERIRTRHQHDVEGARRHLGVRVVVRREDALVRRQLDGLSRPHRPDVGDLDRRRQVHDCGGHQRRYHRHVLVAEGPEHVHARCVEELAFCWDEDPDSDGGAFGGGGGGHV